MISKKITVDDIREIKRQLDEAEIPKREYMAWLLLSKEEADYFIKDFGIRLMDMYASDKYSLIEKAKSQQT